MKRLNSLTIVDLEATCWKTTPPEGEASEIIEIGLCTIQLPSLTITEPQSILVCPTMSTVSAFCTELTTLTEQQVSQGLPFRVACQLLQDTYESNPWASYGDYDKHMLTWQCMTQNIPLPLPQTHINVKTWVALALGLSREVSLNKACELLHIPFEGTPHRGDSDAYNVAKIVQRLLQRQRNVV
jgi:inhibitor of KinA sporulation pathway (predicted exonuclease)